MTRLPQFALLHVLVFAEPNGGTMGRWSLDKIRARLCQQHPKSSGEFTRSKVERMIRHLQKGHIIDLDYQPLPTLKRYAEDHRYDKLMADILRWCEEHFPDFRLSATQEVRYDIWRAP